MTADSQQLQLCKELGHGVVQTPPISDDNNRSTTDKMSEEFKLSARSNCLFYRHFYSSFGALFSCELELTLETLQLLKHI